MIGSKSRDVVCKSLMAVWHNLIGFCHTHNFRLQSELQFQKFMAFYLILQTTLQALERATRENNVLSERLGAVS